MCGRSDTVDGDLFVHLAEIAGVFLGFGALIAVRTDEAVDAHTVEYPPSLLWLVRARNTPST